MAGVNSEIATEIEELKEIVAAQNELARAGKKIESASAAFKLKPLKWPEIRQILFNGACAEADLTEAQWQLRLAINQEQRFVKIAGDFEKLMGGKGRLSRIESSWVNSARQATVKLKAVMEYVGAIKANLLRMDEDINKFLRDYAALPHPYTDGQRLAYRLKEFNSSFPQIDDALKRVVDSIQRMLKVQREMLR